jgi:hypothetical protein
MREIMALADRANAWIADKAPWALNKQEGKQDEVQAICATGSQPVPPTGDLPQAGAAATWPPTPSASSTSSHWLERPANAC